MYTYPKLDDSKLKKMKVTYEYSYPKIKFEFISDVYEIEVDEIIESITHYPKGIGAYGVNKT